MVFGKLKCSALLLSYLNSDSNACLIRLDMMAKGMSI